MNSEATREIKVWPVLGLRAHQLRMGAGWRAWTILRAMDAAGSGVVDATAAEDFACELGIPKRRWKRWIKEADAEAFIQPFYRRADTDSPQLVYKLHALKYVAWFLLDLHHIGTRPVLMDANMLIESGWTAYTWGAYLSTLEDRPISRARMREHTAVPETTQRRYEDMLGDGVVNKPNYAVTDLETWCLSGFRAYKGQGFVFRDHPNKKETIAYRLPDSRSVVVPGITPLEQRDRARYVNREIKSFVSELYSARDWEDDPELPVWGIPVFYADRDAVTCAEQTALHLHQKNLDKYIPDRVFVRHTMQNVTGAVAFWKDTSLSINMLPEPEDEFIPWAPPHGMFDDVE